MENSFEKTQFEHEIEAQHELEKIKITEKKLMKEYGGYETLADFVIYLSSMEKIFARSRIYDSSQATTKNEIIKAEMQLFSVKGVLDEDVLGVIKEEFNLTYATVSQVYTVADKLLQEFSDQEECQKFIESLRDISVVFVEAHDKHFTIDEVQDRIYRSHMQIISVNGNPELSLLEKIYGEFKHEIEATNR